MIETIYSGRDGSHLRVSHHRPVRKAVISALTVVALGVGGWSLYRLGLEQGGHNARAARATEAHLRVKVSELRERIGALSERNTMLERSRRIDQQALERMREALAERGRRIAKLEEELAFYRNVVSPSQMEPGLHVRRLAVNRVSDGGREYRYELVLTQLNSDDRHIVGGVDFSLHGARAGEEVTLAYKELAVGDSVDPPTFRFKYFQTLRGRFRLPEEFEPARLQLRVEPDGSRIDPVEKDYPWDALLAGGS